MKASQLLIVLSAMLALSACSKQETVTQCTTADVAQWLDQAQFQADLVSQGYAISEFKITEGNCYEIYGQNQAGEKVEIYFNPVDGTVVKEEKE